MSNIAIGNKYLPNLQYHRISKVQCKVADKVDYNHAPGVIDECAVAARF